MRVTFGALVIAAGICGSLSFAFLATSLGTEYWYIIEMNPMNMSDFEDVSSHSGLWSINEGKSYSFKSFCLIAFLVLAASQHAAVVFNNPISASVKLYLSNLHCLDLQHPGGKMYVDSIDSFRADYSRYSETEQHMLSESSCTDETLSS